MKTTLTPDDLLTQVFNALAHPSRLEILGILRSGEACVCHIQAMLNQRQSYISQHLNVLRSAGLVTSRKDGLRVYYQVSDTQLFEIIECMQTFLQMSGNWHPEFVLRDSPRQPCTCPQCAEKQLPVQIEASHA